MAGRFPDTGPIPPIMPLGRGTPFPPAPPAPGTVSFNRKPLSGTLTIDALMARQKAAAAAQQAALQQPQTTLAGGAGQMLTSYLEGKKQYDAEQQEGASREALTQLLSGYDPTATNAQAMAAQAMQYDPAVGKALISELISSRRDAANQEMFTTLTPEEEIAAGLDPAGAYQRSSLDKKVSKIGGDGTSITVNPPSAETAAKLGLANGFLDNYDNILKSAEAGEMTGTGWVTGVTLGRGNGGTQYRNLLQGTEAMVRLLTGAGMSESEARGRVRQYEPAATDDAPTLVSKIQGLKQALDNVREGVASRQPGGKDETAEPSTTDPAAAQPFPEDGTPEVGITYTFSDGTTGTYLGGDVSSPKSWKPVAKPGGP